MKNNCYIRICFAIGMLLFLVILSIHPIVFGYDISISNNGTKTMDSSFDRQLYPEYYNFYNVDEISESIYQQTPNIYSYHRGIESDKSNIEKPIQPLYIPKDSIWPIHGHDVRHTGRSPYSTANNPGEEKWWFKLDSKIEGSPVIDDDGVIYFGSWDDHLYALYPNGSLKWKSYTGGTVETSPAIADDGTIYVGTHFSPDYGTYLFAFSPNGTLKWKYKIENLYVSPAISDDGIIYCSDGGNCIIALYPNGTLKWCFETGARVLSSPAISEDGIVYCGSLDNNVYALYPNGTMKWKFSTGNWVHGIPTIGDDGIVYIGSDNGYLYALYPNNGTMKWRCSIGASWCSPALDTDGNIYVGVWEKKFYAIYPNGSIKWSTELGRRVWGMSAAVSADGVIYFGTCDFEGHDGGHLYGLNPDGTIKFILSHTRMFFASPAIGENGTIYICTRQDQFKGSGYVSTGYLRALSDLDPNAPSAPQIKGKTKIIPRISYKYTFKSISPLGNDLYYWIDWGDSALEEWIGPYASGEEITVSHRWENKGTYIISAKVKDTDNLWGPWGEFKINMPKSIAINFNSLLLKLSEKFPLLERLLTCLY